MANGTGIAIIDFGAYPGAGEASVSVTGLSGIGATSKAEAWIMGDDTTADHSAPDHRYMNLLSSLTCSTPIPGVGFDIRAVSTERFSGTFQVRYVWAD